MLIYLAQNGYEVIIPENVALEACITRNGVSINDFFDNGGDSSIFASMGRFLKRVPHLSGNVYIAPPYPQDVTPAAVYAQTLWRIIGANDGRSKKYAIINLIKQYPTGSRKNYGDVAACQLVRFMKKPMVPIFYLSHDRAALTNIASARPNLTVILMH